ncbi:MAG: YbhB/YbcL family Raf kinase inhibitor-like protein [Myxococcales bacterium]|nr:MAG: YbhB/YbcL family Raf kinase inhibitor-like protein [Myxococcales bacterium]
MGDTCNNTENEKGNFILTSTAFSREKSIPTKYTCEGENISFPLEWRGFPKATKNFALIMEDPDAPHGVFVHWVAWGLEKNISQLKENSSAAPGALQQGLNSTHKNGYMGPCPPSGTHRYFVRLYALDIVLNLPKETTKEKLLHAIKGHTIATAELMGTYKKIANR